MAVLSLECDRFYWAVHAFFPDDESLRFIDRDARRQFACRDAHLLELSSYVVLNPVRAKMGSPIIELELKGDTHSDGAIEIQQIGLRPVDKLNEELLIGANAEAHSIL